MINTGQYCEVNLDGLDSVTNGPMLLPQNYRDQTGVWRNNVNNTKAWSDAKLLTIQLYPYVENDPGRPGEQFNKGFSDFTIHPTYVSRDVIYTAWTQEQVDRNADTTLANSQRLASDLARQTEAILQQNALRNDNGKTPLIPAADLADVNAYLGSLYDAMDDPANPVTEPPGATRQMTEVPGEKVDRGVIRRAWTEFGGFDYQVLEYTLYSAADATGMSMKVHRGNGGIYLATYTLTETEPGSGIWKAQTNLNAEFLEPEKAYDIVLFKGVDISQKITLDIGQDELIFDVRWFNSAGLQASL